MLGLLRLLHRNSVNSARNILLFGVVDNGVLKTKVKCGIVALICPKGVFYAEL